MAKSDQHLYDKWGDPYTATDEGYTDCGADAFSLGDVRRAFRADEMVVRTASGGGGDLLVQDVDYEVINEDFYYTEETGYHVYTKVRILTVGYQTGTLYFSYVWYGTYTDLDTFEALLAAYTLTDPKFRITMHTPHGFHGDVLWASATQLQIKPKNKDGQRFAGAILNDGSDGGFLSLTTDRVVDITAAGDEGILDGVTRIANALYRLVAYMGSDEALHFGLSWMPSTSFSNNNPTNALTLNTVTPVGGAATNIGTLFSIAGRLALWSATTKFETPLFYSGGALDATRDKPKVKSDRIATSLTLEDVLSIANFSANDIVYQVDGFKPLQVSDGLIASAIGDRGYMDTGIRILTDASGNIRPFIIIGNKFWFVNGDGAADDDYDEGPTTHTLSTSWTQYRETAIPPDKCGIFIAGFVSTVVGSGIFSRPYWATYGETIWQTAYTDYQLLMEELKMMHQIVSLKYVTTNPDFTARGYII